MRVTYRMRRGFFGRDSSDVRWRRIDLQRVIADKFKIAYHQRSIGKLLKHLGFSHISARPRHPGQDGEVIAAFKKTGPTRSRRTSRA